MLRTAHRFNAPGSTITIDGTTMMVVRRRYLGGIEVVAHPPPFRARLRMLYWRAYYRLFAR